MTADVYNMATPNPDLLSQPPDTGVITGAPPGSGDEGFRTDPKPQRENTLQEVGPIRNALNHYKKFPSENAFALFVKTNLVSQTENFITIYKVNNIKKSTA